ncbi:PIN-like domain-containing protein [Billgrantia desiderata]|uniref:PIN-like domain-containing protein n=1 Tax=Billgrantia desiderata TaxID=52021 RepID=UPI00111F130B|nr:PIN domain-containing protein [Halomonas desiderata]
MKDEFWWYFKPDSDEIDHIWKNGILTVDANVLLDLYRYHENTRNSLLDSLQSFEGTLWITRQASEEFFRNRNSVIVSAHKKFKEAKDEVEKLRTTIEASVNQLKGNRIIPDKLADKLLEDILPVINSTQDTIEETKKNHPNFLKEDTVLEKVASLFVGSVGSPFPDSDLDSIKSEADRRKNEKIPPGYLDDAKDGERPYGDFFLWKQIIDYSKESNKPIVFVTSERKEDWWEKISGRTTGPRPELLREAFEHSGQRILIYQTDRFLEYSSQRTGKDVDAKAVEEIRAVDILRAEKELAVEIVAQNIELSTENHNAGQIVLRLRRPVANFTGSGHFDPVLECAPDVSVDLVSAPANTPPCIVKSGTGTNYDFNIHVRPSDSKNHLPIGEYIFEYKALCENEEKIIEQE